MVDFGNAAEEEAIGVMVVLGGSDGSGPLHPGRLEMSPLSLLRDVRYQHSKFT